MAATLEDMIKEAMGSARQQMLLREIDDLHEVVQNVVNNTGRTKFVLQFERIAKNVTAQIPPDTKNAMTMHILAYLLLSLKADAERQVPGMGIVSMGVVFRLMRSMEDADKLLNGMRAQGEM